jgi:hypothetical protein
MQDARVVLQCEAPSGEHPCHSVSQTATALDELARFNKSDIDFIFILSSAVNPGGPD